PLARGGRQGQIRAVGLAPAFELVLRAAARVRRGSRIQRTRAGRRAGSRRQAEIFARRAITATVRSGTFWLGVVARRRRTASLRLARVAGSHGHRPGTASGGDQGPPRRGVPDESRRGGNLPVARRGGTSLARATAASVRRRVADRSV